MLGIKKYSLEKIKNDIDIILSNELKECPYEIFVNYCSSNKHYLFTYKVNENKIHLKVNVQTIVLLLRTGIMDSKLTLYFCAWYMANYINMVDILKCRKQLDSYCAGILYYEALFDWCCGKHKFVYVPMICEKIGGFAKKMYVMDVRCEVDTLLKFSAFFACALSVEQRKEIDWLIKERMLYLERPEVVYKRNGIASLSIKEVLTKIRLMKKWRKQIGVTLPQLPRKNDEDLVLELICKYRNDGDLFWLELLMRMVLCSPYTIKKIADKEILQGLFELIEKYEDDMVGNINLYETSSNKILIDDLCVILKFVQCSESVFDLAHEQRKKKRAIYINC